MGGQRVFDENQGALALIRLANQFSLSVQDYERLAMAVFGEMIAKDAAGAQTWKREQSGAVASLAYGDGGAALEKHKSLDPCWRRLKQDLYSGKREAFVGVQLALLYASRTGLLANPRWGGERKREVEREFAKQGWDPMAPPGMRAAPQTPGTANAPPPGKFVAPDVSSTMVRALPLHEQLGIADLWVALSDDERRQVNGMLASLDERRRLEELKAMAGEQLYTRMGNRDIPPGPGGDWLRDLPPQLAQQIEQLPPRSRAVLEGRYHGFAEAGNLRELHTELNNLMVRSDGRVGGEELLKVLEDDLCASRDSVGAVLRYEMRLEQGTMSFPAYLTLRARQAPKLAAQERQMATRHARERLRQRQARRSGGAQDQHMAQTHRRLRAEAFVRDPAVVAAVKKAEGTLQTLSGGISYAVYDDYYIIVERMPPGVTPEAFVLLLASDLDKTVDDWMFRQVNTFKRRATGQPRVGEIIDIDIGGPDNGSVMLTELKPTYFVYTCINTSWGGEHPEYGSREFGIQKLNDGRIKVYTRAVSSSSDLLVATAGPVPQQTSWARLLKGISNTIERRGGSVVDKSFQNSAWRVNK